MKMTILRKLFGKKGYQPGQRIRICQQCGMPVGEHKEWCSVFKMQQEMQSSEEAAGKK
jgi:hypothetical protein